MLESLLVAGAISLAQPQLAEAFYTHYHVKQVFCDTARGTAVRLERGRFATVSHVTSNKGCKIEGQPVKVEYDDPFTDFAIVTIPNDPGWGGVELNCAGFQEGYWYYAVGFARGIPASVVISIRNGGPFVFHTYLRSWSIFKGIEYIIPGMSGGMAMDFYGRMTGMNNAYNDEQGLSWSLPISETILCEGRDGAPL